jgi:peptidoglycan hydrolase-like protein with peptidoglycan-binding domain
MDEKEQKQLARKRRERRLRGWLITLSWTTPVVAFGGFFTVWHHISNAINPPQQSSQTAVSSAGTNNSQDSVLFHVGSTSKQVRAIQEQLAELGYFHHEPTHYYGAVTADAVKAFQADHHLLQTGSIDNNTLNAISQAVKDNSTDNLVQSGDYGDGQNNGYRDNGSDGQYDTSGDNGLSQQQTPVTTSSAS